jgi:hypothetical protein
MRTVDFSKVLVDAIQLCGLDRLEIQNQTFMQMRDFATNRLKMAWEWDRFPDLMRTEQVAVLKDGDINYFVKGTQMGEIFDVWNRHPAIGTRAINVGYTITTTDTEDRVIVGDNYNGILYAEYRINPPYLWGNLWSGTTEYHVGSQVYFDSGSNAGTYQPVDGHQHTANFYVCLTQNTNTNPEQNTTNWKKVAIPQIFGNYVSRGILADYLRSEGQFESAQVAENEAKHFLDVEIDKIVRQQGQIQKFNFIKTY